MEGDAVFLARRAHEERVAAMKAAHPLARRAHLEMAERYEELAKAITAQQTRIGGATFRAS
jgi:hypothetical protein